MVAYFLAAALAALAASRSRGDARFWTLLTLVLVALGINKQLDLQSLLTTIGRNLAHRQHWYDRRRTYQFLFIVGLVVGAAITLAVVWHRTRRRSGPVRAALIGLLLLALFIAVRAASFDHVDLLLMRSMEGWRLNWILELAGIAAIAIPATIAARGGGGGGGAPRRSRRRR